MHVVKQGLFLVKNLETFSMMLFIYDMKLVLSSVTKCVCFFWFMLVLLNEDKY